MSVFKMLAHYILLGSALLCNSLHFHAHVLLPQTRTRYNCFSMKTRARWCVYHPFAGLDQLHKSNLNAVSKNS